MLNADSLMGQPDILHHSNFNNGGRTQKEPDSEIVADIEEVNEQENDDINKSDLESEDEDTPIKPQTSERRRNQNKAFSAWFVLTINKAPSPLLNTNSGCPSERNK